MQQLYVFAVEPSDALDELGERRYWRAGTRAETERVYDLLPLREQDLQLARPPGLYVIGLFVAWEELGDASYGFLIEVLPLRLARSWRAGWRLALIGLLLVLGAGAAPGGTAAESPLPETLLYTYDPQESAGVVAMAGGCGRRAGMARST